MREEQIKIGTGDSAARTKQPQVLTVVSISADVEHKEDSD